MRYPWVIAAFWIANRNALVGVVPFFWGLLAYIKWRKEGWYLEMAMSALPDAVTISADGELRLPHYD